MIHFHHTLFEPLAVTMLAKSRIPECKEIPQAGIKGVPEKWLLTMHLTGTVHEFIYSTEGAMLSAFEELRKMIESTREQKNAV